MKNKNITICEKCKNIRQSGRLNYCIKYDVIEIDYVSGRELYKESKYCCAINYGNCKDFVEKRKWYQFWR